MSTQPSPDAIARAGKTFAAGRRATAQMTAREQAVAAWTPTGPSIDELEERIRQRRGLPTREQQAS